MYSQLYKFVFRNKHTHTQVPGFPGMNRTCNTGFLAWISNKSALRLTEIEMLDLIFSN